MLLHISEEKDKKSGAWCYVLTDEDPARARPKLLARAMWGYGIRSRLQALEEVRRLGDYVLRCSIFTNVSGYRTPPLRVVK